MKTSQLCINSVSDLFSHNKKLTDSQIVYVCHCICLGKDPKGRNHKYSADDKDWAIAFIKAYDNHFKQIREKEEDQE